MVDVAVSRPGISAGAVAAVAALGASAVLRRVANHTGATAAEARAPMAGDDIVPHPMVEWTRGTTIDATPREVWPWLVQMGYGRAGWYTPEWVDKVFRIEAQRSAEVLVPQYQDVEVGDIIQDGPDYEGYFRLKVLEPERAIVYWSRRHPWRGHPVDPTDEEALAQLEASLLAGGIYLDFSWGLTLREIAPGRTRVLLRTRANYAPRWLPATMLGLADVSIGGTMLRALKERVEGGAHGRSDGGAAPAERRLEVHLCEEAPTADNLKQASLVSFPATVFLAAPDRAAFERAGDLLREANPDLRPGWWVQPPRSLMVSAFSDADELEAARTDLLAMPAGQPVLLDLEVPFWDRKRLVHRPSDLRRTADAFAALVATAERRHELWTAEWPPPGIDWPRSLRLTVPSARERAYMLYSTMMPGWWQHLLALRLERRFRSEPGVVGVGTLAPGIAGDEPVLTPDQLRRDLRQALEMGARGVIVYRLAGLTPDHATVCREFASPPLSLARTR